MQVTRRGLLKFAGASAAGIMFSPLPWKLLDDIAIWTQTGSWIPKVPRGPLTTAFSTCSLCPGGCAVEARCVNGVPFALRAAVNHKAGRGALCPVGITGHHLAYHPLRLAGPSLILRTGDMVETQSITAIEAFDRIQGSLSARPNGTSIAILDQRPGRTISAKFQEFIAKQQAAYYIVPDDDRFRSQDAYARSTGRHGKTFGYDLDRTTTLLTIGTPLFDGWTRPARTAAIFDRRKDVRNPLKHIHADPRRTRTTALADQWLPIAPGTETTLVLGLANIVMRDHPSLAAQRAVDMRVAEHRGMSDVISLFTPELVSQRTGITVDVLEEVGSALAHKKPSLVIAGGDAAGSLDRSTHQAVAALNILLGSFGSQGGVLQRDDLLSTTKNLSPISTIDDIPDGSISLLIIDGEEATRSTSWEVIESKLSPLGHLVVSTSPFLTQVSAHVDIILPSPAPYEMITDVVGDPTDTVASFTVSSPLLPKREGSVETIALLNHLSGESHTMEELIKGRITALLGRGRGTVAAYKDGSSQGLSQFSSADEVWNAFKEGATWTNPPRPGPAPIAFALMGGSRDMFDTWTKRAKASPDLNSPDGQVILLPIAANDAASTGQLSPLTSKIYQESEVRPIRGLLVLHPDTGRRCGVDDGDAAVVQTEVGSRDVSVRFSPALMPGVAQLSIGPDPNTSGKASGASSSDVFATSAQNSPMTGMTAVVRKA